MFATDKREFGGQHSIAVVTRSRGHSVSQSIVALFSSSGGLFSISFLVVSVSKYGTGVIRFGDVFRFP